jgi:hypothetical protein
MTEQGVLSDLQRISTMNKATQALLQDLLAYGHVPVSIFKAHQRNAVNELMDAGLVRVFPVNDTIARVELRLGLTALHHFTAPAQQ